MFYQIKETLTKTTLENCILENVPYVIVIDSNFWNKNKEIFNLEIDIDFENKINSTKAEVNYDSLTGTFYIPKRENLEENESFSFALDEKGIIFIDDNKYSEKIINKILKTKKWKYPSLERFIYDFLEIIVVKDFELLDTVEQHLIKIEYDLLNNIDNKSVENLNDVRSTLLSLKVHYEHLIYLSQELEENENEYFNIDNLRYFHLFSSRISRLQNRVNYLREYNIQIRDLQKNQMDQKQNKIISTLTIITTIFLPLTLIAGWYGMNFKYMPELNSPLGYPVVIIVSILIPIISITFFKYKKWI